jgi:hypothetical protein
MSFFVDYCIIMTARAGLNSELKICKNKNMLCYALIRGTLGRNKEKIKIMYNLVIAEEFLTLSFLKHVIFKYSIYHIKINSSFFINLFYQIKKIIIF